MTASEQAYHALASSHDIIEIGMQADEVRRGRNGTKTTFVRVADVAADSGAPVTAPVAAGEIRIVGVPESRAAATARVMEVKAAANGTPVSGFSLADLEALSAKEQITLRALLEELEAAGLELVAEAPVDRLQDPRRSIEEVNIAGLTLARLTVHRSSSRDLVTFLSSIAELQRAVAVIRAFAPLPRFVNPEAPSTGYDDVKRVALARLVVSNVPSIQVDWSIYGPKLAQVALTVGADDLDGVSASDESPDGPRRAPVEIVRGNIRAAGLTPVERNGRFEPVVR
jgi:aminodeoxyfutalosine synthase